MIAKNYSDEDLAEIIEGLRSIAEYGFELYRRNGTDAQCSAGHAAADGKCR